jgi:hypothetical protein
MKQPPVTANWKIKTSIFIAPLLLFCSTAHALIESHYQRAWCSSHNGTAEVVMPDGSRCDCVTGTHAVEIDFAPKWPEAIGQALLYSLSTGKRAGIVLIADPVADQRYIERLRSVVRYYSLPIDVFVIHK